jgi:hypothetical protein
MCNLYIYGPKYPIFLPLLVSIFLFNFGTDSTEDCGTLLLPDGLAHGMRCAGLVHLFPALLLVVRLALLLLLLPALLVLEVIIQGRKARGRKR